MAAGARRSIENELHRMKERADIVMGWSEQKLERLAKQVGKLQEHMEELDRLGIVEISRNNQSLRKEVLRCEHANKFQKAALHASIAREKHKREQCEEALQKMITSSTMCASLMYSRTTTWMEALEKQLHARLASHSKRLKKCVSSIRCYKQSFCQKPPRIAVPPSTAQATFASLVSAKPSHAPSQRGEEQIDVKQLEVTLRDLCDIVKQKSHRQEDNLLHDIRSIREREEAQTYFDTVNDFLKTFEGDSLRIDCQRPRQSPPHSPKSPRRRPFNSRLASLLFTFYTLHKCCCY